ncbi:MAG TPA: hypothetical protein VMT52_14220 [Planctomycetota bacterium]|nr:hypothetical protein [Planctomycetota bacterium]
MMIWVVSSALEAPGSRSERAELQRPWSDQWWLRNALGVYVYGRWLIVLRGKDGSFRWVGELPGDMSGKGGGMHSVGSKTEIHVNWTGHREAPVRIDLTERRYDHEVGEGAVGLPSLETRRDGILEGSLPARFRWTTKDYVVAEEGDTLETVVHRLSVWSVGYSTGRESDNEKIKNRHRRALKKLNIDLPDGKIPEGTRIRIVRNVHLEE